MINGQRMQEIFNGYRGVDIESLLSEIDRIGMGGCQMLNTRCWILGYWRRTDLSSLMMVVGRWSQTTDIFFIF